MQAGADRELIEASRSGDRAAFARLIERHQRAVYAVAFSATRDRSLADDVTQDAFVTAWRRLADLRDPERLPAWLCGIARNVARDARKRRRGEVQEDVDIAGETTPYDAITEAESERIVTTALGEMPEVYREPLVLFYYEERSVDDVARYLGLSPATTHKRLSRGRQYLADRVATIVERGLPRRGASATLAASVLALIGVTLPAPHVVASPAPNGSTMKLAIAAALATLVTGGTIAVVAATRTTDAASSPKASAPAASPSAAMSHMHHAMGAATGCMHGGAAAAPALPALLKPHRERAAITGATDCAAVGNHLAELETATGAGDDPARCATDFAAICQSEGWTLERRTCALAADDLMNAHLCALGLQAGSDEQVPPALACAAIAPHIAPIVQSAGLYGDVPDFAQQVEDACDAGSWSIALRQCFMAAQTVDTLHACVQPPSP
jgi:RNA polymerase sigma factor (sigma-70 family)